MWHSLAIVTGLVAIEAVNLLVVVPLLLLHICGFDGSSKSKLHVHATSQLALMVTLGRWMASAS